MRVGRPFGVVAATAVVGAGTAANRLAGLPLSWVAATPRAVGDGRWWLVLTSGLLADTPWLPSLLGFAIVLAVALRVLPARRVVAAGAAGQILSALAVYGVIALARLRDPHAFGSVVDVEDFGVSAFIAAWIGAVAYVSWTRAASRRGRALVAAGCLGCLGIGLACRPTITFLDSEHLVAFAIGAVVASSFLGRVVMPVRKAVATAVAALGALAS